MPVLRGFFQADFTSVTMPADVQSTAAKKGVIPPLDTTAPLR